MRDISVLLFFNSHKLETTLELKRQLGLVTAIFIIIADVIGTGIFVTTGSVLGMTGNAFIVLLLWGIGGIVAITGALCYAELAVMWPDDGGEYIYLKKIFGMLPSFLTGWISLVVGFTASVAISSLTLVWYLSEFCQIAFLADPVYQKVLAAGLIVLFGIIHIYGVKQGSFLQNGLTVLKLLIVVSFITFGFVYADWSQADRLTMAYSSGGGKSITDYGLVLLLVMFAYSGWNGASYMAGEIKNPEKNLPRAMFFGTLLITFLYILLNVVYIISSPGTDLLGKHAIGAIAAGNLFGTAGASMITLGIALILLSAVSVQMMIGPRVYYAMAKDRMIFHSLERVNPRFLTPDLAIIIQTCIAVVYVMIGKNNIEALLIYMGFSLNIFPLLSVIGLMIMRKREPELERPFKVPFYPVVPLIYIVLTFSMMVAALVNWTKTSLFACGVVAVGVVVYFIWQKILSIKGADSE